MAQREKEDTELHVPETIVLCANNCGFSGNPATNNMCQACFQASAASSPPNPTSCSPRSAPIRTPELATEASKEAPKEERSQKAVAVATAAATAAASEAAPSKSVNRCFGCRKRVRLAGFRCRCGELFCGEHRYSDRHDCGFDYKTAAQSAIARQNPVVRAAKIIRI